MVISFSFQAIVLLKVGLEQRYVWMARKLQIMWNELLNFIEVRSKLFSCFKEHIWNTAAYAGRRGLYFGIMIS